MVNIHIHLHVLSAQGEYTHAQTDWLLEYVYLTHNMQTTK